MTMVIGIVTEVAIFYFAELDLDSGHDVKQDVRAGVFRMRPILMISIIAILVLTPTGAPYRCGFGHAVTARHQYHRSAHPGRAPGLVDLAGGVFVVAAFTRPLTLCL
jgi:hypothetical protein